LFRVAPRFNLKQLEKIFRYRVLKMLLDKGRITEEFIRQGEPIPTVLEPVISSPHNMWPLFFLALLLHHL
jgi:hypothetical protein